MAEHLRPARQDDTARLSALAQESFLALSARHYAPEVASAALPLIGRFDPALFGRLLLLEDASGLLACGGWSPGHPAEPAAQSPPVHLRAFFVRPERAGRGLGSRLLLACEAAARAEGHNRFAVFATLNAEPFYARHGYAREALVTLDLAGLPFPAVRMRKG